MDDRLLRRAGLDYHEYADVRRHASWPAFLARRGADAERLFAFTTRRRARASPTSPCRPATGSCSAPRPPGLPDARARRIAAGAARAPADARRPAQPQPQQRGRGRGVRGLAPERLRRRRLSRRSRRALAAGTESKRERRTHRSMGRPDFSAAHAVLHRHCAHHRLSGVSTLIVRGAASCSTSSASVDADIEQGRPLRPDHIHRAHSNTKLITAVTILMLVDEGARSRSTTRSSNGSRRFAATRVLRPGCDLARRSPSALARDDHRSPPADPYRRPQPRRLRPRHA